MERCIITTTKHATMHCIQTYFRSAATARVNEVGYNVISLRLRSSMPEVNSPSSDHSTPACRRRRAASRPSPSEHVRVLEPKSAGCRLASAATGRLHLSTGNLAVWCPSLHRVSRRLLCPPGWNLANPGRVQRFAWFMIGRRRTVEKTRMVTHVRVWTAMISDDTSTTTW